MKFVTGLVKSQAGLVSLLVLVLFNIAFTPNFLQFQTLAVNVSQVATIGIVAIGMTLVIATGGIDLSVGAVMALAGAIAPLIFLSSWGVANPWPALILSIAVSLFASALCGVFNGALISYLGVQPIVATLILFISGRGVAQILTNGNLQTFNNPLFSALGTEKVFGIPAQGWLLLFLAILFSFVIRRTAFGRRILATGGSEKAALLTGISIHRVRISIYVICATLAGLAGLIVVAINSASDAARNGELMELDAIAAAVVGGAALSGGRAPIFGAMIGACIIQLVKYTLLANGIADEVAMIVKSAIIVVAVYVQMEKHS